MRCLHEKHSLTNYYQTSYSQQTCRQCVLTHYNKNVKLRATVSEGSNKGVDVEKHDDDETPFHLQPRHCVYIDGHDVRPSEIPAFLNNLSLNDRVLERHKPAWEKDEEDLDEKLLVDDAQPPLTTSLTVQKMKELEFSQQLLNDKEKLNRLSTEQFYKTSTQKLYAGARWSTCLKPKQVPPLHTLNFNKTFPPPRTKWRHDGNDYHQTLPGQLTWDYTQVRSDTYKENMPLSFTTNSRKSRQIPNYAGTIVGRGEKDINQEDFTPLTTVRTHTPRDSETSRKPHIPGYGGFTPRDRYQEVFRDEKSPRPESTARTYSRHELYSSDSVLYGHRSTISKTVTLVNPYNPYNKVNYPHCRTVGNNRV